MEKKKTHEIKKRDINLAEKGRVKIKTEIGEELSIDEFRGAYQESLNKSENLKHQIEVYGNEIKKMGDFKETKKDIELAEHLEKANKVIKRKLLKEKMEEMQKNLEVLKKDLLRFSPHIAQLNQKDKREETYIG